MAKEISREALYELVWAKPMRTAAADIGISDVGLKKRCKSRGVPVPPRGYWNKFLAGHQMPKRPELPLRPPPKPAKLPSRPLSPARVPAVSGGSRKRQEQRIQSKAPNSKKRRRRGTARRFQYEHYVLAIDRWEWNYGFGINKWKNIIRGHYLDRRSLQIYGRLLRPAPVEDAIVSMTFMPANMDNRIEGPDGPRTDIGWLSRRRGEGDFESFVFMPEDALPSLLQMLIGEKLRFVVLDGLQLHRGRTDVRDFSFRADWSEEPEEGEEAPVKPVSRA